MSADLTYTEALARLSRRECEVLVLYAEGNTAAQIAKILYISTRTVEKHLENIGAILEIHGRGKLKAWLEKVYKSPSG